MADAVHDIVASGRPARPARSMLSRERCRLQLSWVFLGLMVGSLAASSIFLLRSKGPDAESQCFDSQRNAVVERTECPSNCCVYKVHDVQGEEYDTEQAYCGSEQECESKQRHNTKETIGIIAGYLVLMMLYCLPVRFLGCQRQDLRILHQQQFANQQEKKTWEQRKIDTTEKLDSAFPATMYDNVDDLEQQLQSAELCCICLDELKDTMIRKLHCSHVLHQDCFDRWCLYSSDPESRFIGVGNKAEEQLWVCPLCKHPAIPEKSS